jgi:RNA polymerase sigma-70 factor (ECF subfamily)
MRATNLRHADKGPSDSRPKGAPAGRGFCSALLAELPALKARARALEFRDTAARDDLIQDTIERALACHKRFTCGNLRAWLLRIMHNLFIDRCRERRQYVGPAAVETTPAPPVETEPPRPWERVALPDILAALERIEEPLRETFVLACLRNRPYREIARLMSIPTATVGTRVYRVRMHLRGLLLARLGIDEAAPAPSEVRPPALLTVPAERPRRRAAPPPWIERRDRREDDELPPLPPASRGLELTAR